MEIQKYQDMKDNGAKAETIYWQTREDNLSALESFKVIMQLFGLSLGEAKVVTHKAYAKESGLSLDSYYKRLANSIENALVEDDENED